MKLFFVAIVVSDLCVLAALGDIDMKAFSNQIHLELAPVPPISQVSFPPRKQHLQLARIEANAGKTTEALAEYAKAADSDDAVIREAALAETKELLTKSNRFYDWISDQFEAEMALVTKLVVPALLLGFGGLVATRIGKIRRRRRRQAPLHLDVKPFRYSSAGQISELDFREVVVGVQELLDAKRQLEQQVNLSLQRNIRTPIVFGSNVDDLKTPVSFISDKAWPIFIWLLRKLDPADYTLVGSSSLYDTSHHIVVRLRKDDKAIKRWSRLTNQANLFDSLSDLALSTLHWLDRPGRI